MKKQLWRCHGEITQKKEQKVRTGEELCNLVSSLVTCVAPSLLPPISHVGLVTAPGADLTPVLHRACGSVLSRPAAQRCCRHGTLQLRGGSESVGHPTRAHRLDAV